MQSLLDRVQELPDLERQGMLALLEEYEAAKQREVVHASFLDFVKVMWPAFIEGYHHSKMAEAFEKGLRVGDIITEAGQQPILSITDLEDRITEAKDGGRKSLLLLVRRAGDPRFVALGLGD